MPKISVIVPVYNVEKYLRRCVDSILSQTFGDIEILLINDGSRDNSGSICDEYKIKDSRIKVFHKENGGVSSARNLGLSKANGEWIAYVDGDDWIDSLMFEKLYNVATMNNVDIVYSDFIMNFNDYEEYYMSAKYSSDKNQMMKNYITSVWTSMVNMIVKRELFVSHQLLSPIHLSYCEDFWLSVRLFYFAESVSYINEAFYNYRRINNTSRVNNLNKQTERDEQLAYLETINFFEAQGFLHVVEREMAWRILKSKQELILNPADHNSFLTIYPASHKYIWSCPYINTKLKVMMALLTKNMSFVLIAILKLRGHIRGSRQR